MEFVDLHAQYLTIRNEIDEAIASVIRESSFIRGRHVEEFERKYAELVGARHCISCGDGTDAIYIALRALGAGPGDEIIVPAHTWIASAETVTQAGAEVVFCDSEDDYFTIDPGDVERKITARTRGIVVVHLYGQPARMDSLMSIATKHGLWVIEDCAQAHLSRFGTSTVGTMGDVGTFSFYPGKNLGAMGDAGCLITGRDDVASFAALFARHGGKGDHVIEGINSRLDGMQAAILNVKMKYLAAWTERRQHLARRYDELLCDVEGITIPKRRPGSDHVFHLYVLRCANRDALQLHLRNDGIPTLVNYSRALPFYPAYARLDHKPEDFPVAFRDQTEILSIPLYPEITEAAQERIAASIRQFAGGGYLSALA